MLETYSTIFFLNYFLIIFIKWKFQKSKSPKVYLKDTSYSECRSIFISISTKQNTSTSIHNYIINGAMYGIVRA